VPWVKPQTNLSCEQTAEALAMVRYRSACERRGESPRCYGISSDALMNWGLFGDPIPRGSYPLDQWDLAACELTYEMAPRWAKTRMFTQLLVWRELVDAHERRMGRR
jgi:hypothetical protein